MRIALHGFGKRTKKWDIELEVVTWLALWRQETAKKSRAKASSSPSYFCLLLVLSSSGIIMAMRLVSNIVQLCQLHPHSPTLKSRKTYLARNSNGQQQPASVSLEVEEKRKGIGKAEADVVVIGSGIGGLCCAGLLARYQQDVLVLESHDLPGGAAHSFDIKGFKFDSGPSLFSGFQSRGPQANPLAQVTFSSSFLYIFLL